MNREDAKDAKDAKRTMGTVQCPICRGASEHREHNPVFPFCSERCRMIDLGNWLGETYRIPTRESPDEHAVEDDETDPSN